MKTSAYSGFYKLSVADRQKEVAEFSGLDQNDLDLLSFDGALGLDTANHMVENVIGTIQIPFGVAVNFTINGKDYVIPMATEEPSVIAAASNMARLARKAGGFYTSTSGTLMIAQIQAHGVSDPTAARLRVLSAKEELLAAASSVDPMLCKFGGGAKDLEVRVISTKVGVMVVTHLIVDTKDAMGANTVNTMAEHIAPRIEELTGGTVKLRILSNLADKRVARCWTKVNKEDLGGEDVVDGIVEAYAFAAADPYRAATHNKGIMNGITAAVMASGNDTRAIESGAHAYAARNGSYSSLTTWEKDKDGNLIGSIEIPMAVGLVGGATKVHPVAKIAIKILGVKTADELAQIFAALGLAQNLAALKALSTEGIQRGHMSLHARTLAATAGAKGEQIDKIAAILVKEKKVRLERAQELLAEMNA